MTDDFVFGDDADDGSDDGTVENGDELFGSRSAGGSDGTGLVESGRRFGTEAVREDDAPERTTMLTAVDRPRTATVVVLALVLLAVFGLVASPLISNLGSFGGSADDTALLTTDEATTPERSTRTVRSAASTRVPNEAPPAETTSALPPPTRTTVDTPTATPTVRPTTSAPARGFPANDPADENETAGR